MSYSRLPYDPCAYDTDLRQSQGPGSYAVNTPQLSCRACYVANPAVRIGSAPPGVLTSSQTSLVDIDSELMGITRAASRCPSRKYLGPADPSNKRLSLAPLPDCGAAALDAFVPEDTRLSNPPCTMRCRGINRWQWLCRDPQQRIEIPFDWNINYRLVVKDNHRPCVQDPMDPSAAAPPDLPDPDVMNRLWRCGQRYDTDLLPSVSWAPCSRYY